MSHKLRRQLRERLAEAIYNGLEQSRSDAEILADLAQNQPNLWREVQAEAGARAVVEVAAARRKTITARRRAEAEQQIRLFDF